VSAQRLTAGGGLLLLAACSLPWVGLWNPNGVADTGLYGLYGARIVHGLVPYRDFFMEFPPGAIPALALPALAGEHYVAWFKATEFVLALGTLACLVSIVQRIVPSVHGRFAAVALAAVSPALLGAISLNSFDYWPALLTTAAVATLLRGHRRSGFVLLGAATAAKLFPAGLLAVVLLWAARRGGRRWLDALLAYLATVVVVFAPFLAVGPGGVRYSLRTQLGRGLQLESLGGALFTAAHHLAGYRPTYTPNLPYAQLAGPAASAAADLSTVAMVAAILLVAVLYTRTSGDEPDFVLAVAATVVGIVAFAKVLSPQYLVWLIALVAAVSLRVRLAGPLLALSLGLTQVWVPSRFRALQAMDGVTWVLLARDLLLVALFATLVGELRARRPEGAGTATQPAGGALRPVRPPATPAVPERRA
jgi:Glycosyltransferase family 87